MKVVITTWDKADIDELSAVARISVPLFRGGDIERVKHTPDGEFGLNYLCEVIMHFSDILMS